MSVIRRLSDSNQRRSVRAVGKLERPSVIYLMNYSNLFVVNQDPILGRCRMGRQRHGGACRHGQSASSTARPLSSSTDLMGSTDALRRATTGKTTSLSRRSYTTTGIVGYNQAPVYGSFAITTPPYTPGYTIPGSPKQYAIAVNTPANSSAVSGPPSLNAVLALSSTSNGDNVNLRPVVKQTYDRWGNVLTVTDARNAAWVTNYTYNANNEVTQVTQPSTGTGVATPITKTYYDVLGRQIDVKDANGHVNGKSYDWPATSSPRRTPTAAPSPTRTTPSATRCR